MLVSPLLLRIFNKEAKFVVAGIVGDLKVQSCMYVDGCIEEIA